MTVLAAIGEIKRFTQGVPGAKQLVSYAGLGASVHASGETYRTGRITKEGRRDLRWVLIEAAHTAIRAHPYWQGVYERLEHRIGARKAIVAVAGTLWVKLLVVVWQVLSKRTVDRQADAEQVARVPFGWLMTWAWKLTPAQRLGLTSRQFIRYHLLRLQIGNELTHIRRGGTARPLAPPEEVLALRPDLKQRS